MDVPGGFECQCFDGFELDVDGFTCNGQSRSYAFINTYIYTDMNCCIHIILNLISCSSHLSLPFQMQSSVTLTMVDVLIYAQILLAVLPARVFPDMNFSTSSIALVCVTPTPLV